jgi:hypothetical protein
MVSAVGSSDLLEDRNLLFFQGYLSSCAPLLLSQGGYTGSQLSMLEDEARIEAMGCKQPFYVRYLAVTGVKI